MISQICAQSIGDDREILIQSLCSFVFGLCLLFNNNQISTYSTESLERIVKKRIGLELFQEKLETLSKSDVYAKILQKPQLKFSKPTEMILDYEFTRLYKILEGSITRMLTTRTNGEQSKSTSDQSSQLLAQYHQIIQQQNQSISIYQQREQQFLDERTGHQKKIEELEQSLRDIYQQYGILKASTEQGADEGLRSLCEQQQSELEYLRNMIVRHKKGLKSRDWSLGFSTTTISKFDTTDNQWCGKIEFT